MKKFLFAFLCCSASFFCYAQNVSDSLHNEKGKKIKAIYVAYMTQALLLDETEAQKFWPIHNEYDKEMKTAHKTEMDQLVREETLLSIRKRYQEKFIKVIGKDRTNDFYRKDAEFKKRLVDRVKDIRKGKGQGGQRGKKQKNR